MLCSVSSTWITAHSFGINSYTNPGVVTPGAESTSRHGPSGDRPTAPGGTDTGTTVDDAAAVLDAATVDATLDVDELVLAGADVAGTVGNVPAPPPPSSSLFEQLIIAMAANATNAPPRARNTATSTTPTGHSNSAESAKMYPTSCPGPARPPMRPSTDSPGRLPETTLRPVLDLNDPEAVARWLVDNGDRFDYVAEMYS